MADRTDTARDASVALYTRLLDAWNRRDAAAFAVLFSDRGVAIGFDGSQMQGPADIEGQLQSIFASHPTAAYVAKIRDVRRVDTTSAIIRAVAGMVPPGQSRINPKVNAVQTLVTAQEAGQLRIAQFQNTPAAFHERPDLAEALTTELTAVHESGALLDGGEPMPPAEGQFWVEPVGNLIIARVRGLPSEALLRECQDRVLQIARDSGADGLCRVLYDALEMESPTVDVPLAQRQLDDGVADIRLRRAIVVPNTRLAYLARLAFGDGDYRVFYNDIAAAVTWLSSSPV